MIKKKNTTNKKIVTKRILRTKPATTKVKEWNKGIFIEKILRKKLIATKKTLRHCAIITKVTTMNRRAVTKKILGKKLTATGAISKYKRILIKKSLKIKWLKIKKLSRTKKLLKSEKLSC